MPASDPASNSDGPAPAPDKRHVACAACGARFECGAHAAAGAPPCWCVNLPPLPLPAIATGDPRCLCPECLRRRLANAGHRI